MINESRAAITNAGRFYDAGRDAIYLSARDREAILPPSRASSILTDVSEEITQADL